LAYLEAGMLEKHISYEDLLSAKKIHNILKLRL